MTESTVNSEYKPEITIYKSLELMASAFFSFIIDEITSEGNEGKNYNLALSGGSTQIKIFEKLSCFSTGKLKLDHLHLYWGDERCVPPDDPESNYGNAWNTLIRYIDIPDENIHRIHGEADPEEECQRYQDILKRNLPGEKGLPYFNLILLGIGEDGHTASIFPDHMENLISESLCIVASHPVTGQQRISLTGRVINNAEKVLFMAIGKPKARLIKSIIKREKGSEIYPAAHIIPTHGKLKWYLDKEAGRYVKDLL